MYILGNISHILIQCVYLHFSNNTFPIDTGLYKPGLLNLWIMIY